MPWLVIIVSVFVLWVASLCKVLNTYCSPFKATFLSNAGGALRRRDVLLLLAHPDDESMFFTPTLNYLTSRGHNIHILCMSTGNADGMGNIRKQELFQASAVLKVPLHQIKILDHPDFQDGFGKVWNYNLLARILEEEMQTIVVDLIITFDDYGVSGHCNHRDLNQGVRKLLHDSSRDIEAWELVSTNTLRKYSGPVDVWLSILYAVHYPKGEMHCLLNEHPRKSYVAMAQHMSQWVWYRKLFVTFSSFTYVNTLRKINK
ncbi:hypothetical protein RJ640_017684 [Escallonia rubra]|uniref:N-acetylglucosaminylphosphatidylinositol deacetylase n=1 Tax=Escallonia rubra TaxID=112253 RepID=A0AA88U181_9ASTE|nr:hypothetical protein RJ640_017684 [Escallonia rubra]